MREVLTLLALLLGAKLESALQVVLRNDYLLVGVEVGGGIDLGVQSIFAE